MAVIARSFVEATLCALCLATQSCSRSTVSVEEQDVIEAAATQCGFISQIDEHVFRHRTSVDMLWMEHDSYDVFAERLKKEALYKPRDVWETVNDFLIKNRTDSELVFPRRLPPNTQILTAAIDRKLQPQKPGVDNDNKRTEYYDAFRRYFSRAKSVIIISRPGFDSKHDTALIYISKMSGHGGGGAILLLKRIDGKWQLRDCELDHSWISQTA